MTLGIALLAIFILYLVDKHHRWRQLVKLSLWLVVLSSLFVGGLYGWAYWDDGLGYHPEWRMQRLANAECEKTVGQGYTAVDVNASTPLGIACRPPKSSGR
jgi:hypothetical protein